MTSLEATTARESEELRQAPVPFSARTGDTPRVKTPAVARRVAALAFAGALSLVAFACSYDWTVPGGSGGSGTTSSSGGCASCVAQALKGSCDPAEQACCGDPACSVCRTTCPSPCLCPTGDSTETVFNAVKTCVAMLCGAGCKPSVCP